MPLLCKFCKFILQYLVKRSIIFVCYNIIYRQHSHYFYEWKLCPIKDCPGLIANLKMRKTILRIFKFENKPEAKIDAAKTVLIYIFKLRLDFLTEAIVSRRPPGSSRLYLMLLYICVGALIRGFSQQNLTFENCRLQSVTKH